MLQMPQLPQARNMTAVGLAVLVALGLFWIMHYLVLNSSQEIRKTDSFSGIDFVRLKRDSDLETRTRQKPPKPPPPKTPPPPQLKVASTPKPDQNPTPFNMPNLNLSANISGGPFLGNFAAANMTGDGELIPILRIQPQYPREAQREGVTGQVVVEIVVAPDGTVRSVRVVSANPRGYFEQAALSAARKSKFRPKIVDGKAVEQKGIYPYDFKLEGTQ
jgi:periplasmic protein TonB